jgi:hypothetical protein
MTADLTADLCGSPTSSAATASKTVEASSGPEPTDALVRRSVTNP